MDDLLSAMGEAIGAVGEDGIVEEGHPLIHCLDQQSRCGLGRVMHDPDLAEAILDRVLERGRHLDLLRPSYRTKHLKPDVTEPGWVTLGLAGAALVPGECVH
jgi:hypothetical protein